MSDATRNFLLVLILISLAAICFVARGIYWTQVEILAVLSGGCL